MPRGAHSAGDFLYFMGYTHDELCLKVPSNLPQSLDPIGVRLTFAGTADRDKVNRAFITETVRSWARAAFPDVAPENLEVIHDNTGVTVFNDGA